MTRPFKRLESDFQGAIVLRFRERLRRTVWFHVPNGEARDGRTAKRLQEMGVVPGVADFVLLAPGLRLYALELKWGRGKLSDKQEEFRDRWTANGGIYMTAWTIEQVEMLWRIHGWQ